MSTTQPIRNLENLERLKNYFLTECPNLRNYLLVHLSVNTALRISDILSLTWEDVYDFYHFTFREHLILTEKKTKKRKQIPLNENLVESLTSQKLSILWKKCFTPPEPFTSISNLKNSFRKSSF